MVNISTDYLLHNNDLPNYLVSYYMPSNSESFRYVFSKMTEDRMNIFIEPLQIAITKVRDLHNVSTLISAIPADQHHKLIEEIKTAITKHTEQEKPRIVSLLSVISTLSEDQRHKLIATIKITFTKIIEQKELDPLIFSFILKKFPQDQRHKLIEPFKVAITKESNKETPDLKQIRLLLIICPADQHHEFIEPLKFVLTKEARLDSTNIENTIKIIEMMPKEHSVDLLKTSIGAFLANGKNEEVDKILKKYSSDIKTQVLEGLLNDKGYNPEIANKLPLYNKAFAVMSEVGKFMNEVHGNSAIDTKNRGELKQTEVKRNRPVANPNKRNQGRGA